MTKKRLRSLSVEIIRQIAASKPMPLEVLASQVDRELAFARQDRRSVEKLANTLLGAMLRESAKGPEHARIYALQVILWKCHGVNSFVPPRFMMARQAAQDEPNATRL